MILRGLNILIAYLSWIKKKFLNKYFPDNHFLIYKCKIGNFSKSYLIILKIRKSALSKKERWLAVIGE